MKARMMFVLLIIGLVVSIPAFALQCVEYVRQQSGWTDFPQTGGQGEAYRWWNTAQGNGYATGNKPMIGSVLVWKGWSKKDANGKEIGNPAGHVAINASIVSETEIRVNHANWPADGEVRLGVKVTDASGGNWTKVKVNDGSTEYGVYGFIYPKNPPAPTLQCSPISPTRQVCWLPKSPTDLSCENATAWGIEDSVTKTSQPADKSVCSSSCYNGPVSVLDFFVCPALAGTLTSCSKPKTETGSGSNPSNPSSQTDLSISPKEYLSDSDKTYAEGATIPAGTTLDLIATTKVTNGDASLGMKSSDTKVTVRGEVSYGNGSWTQVGDDQQINKDKLTKGSWVSVVWKYTVPATTRVGTEMRLRFTTDLKNVVSEKYEDNNQKTEIFKVGIDKKKAVALISVINLLLLQEDTPQSDQK